MTEPELRILALDIVDGKVFGSWQIPEEDQERLMPVVFMPLVFGAAESLKEQGAVSLYEYRDKAGPTGVNGYPNFMSVKFLTAPDLDILAPLVEQLQQARKQFLKGE